jgi:hypothetical protein
MGCNRWQSPLWSAGSQIQGHGQGTSDSCFSQTFSGERITASLRKHSSSNKKMNKNTTQWSASKFQQRLTEYLSTNYQGRRIGWGESVTLSSDFITLDFSFMELYIILVSQKQDNSSVSEVDSNSVLKLVTKLFKGKLILYSHVFV